MKHVDKVVRIREVRDYVIPVYDEESDEVAGEKALGLLKSDMNHRKETTIVSVETIEWTEI